ncbi:MAG: prolyl oligopeptidase family serine peptidase [Acidobacteriaceae bacterium]|nr:prolyl oligopeptidase family serine peptidase [Acidobacteriaceae bacterium]
MRSRHTAAVAALICFTTYTAAAAAQTPSADVFAPGPSLVPISTPTVPMSLMRKASPYTEHRDAHFESWNPTKRSLLVRTRFGEVPGIHEVSQPLGTRRQMTFLHEPAREAHWQPKLGTYFTYMSDTGGAEQYQLFRKDVATGETTLLTDGKSRNMYSAASPDGHYIAWASTHRNGADLDLWMEDPLHPESAHMLKEWKGGGLQVQDWSPDAKSIVVLNYVAVTDSSLSLVNAETGEVRNLTAELTPGTPMSWAEARFSPDGKSILALSDMGSEYHRLWRLPLNGGKPVCLTPKIQRGIDVYAITKDGSTIAYSLNDEGVSRLHLMRAATGAELPAPTLPTGVIMDMGFHPLTGELAVSFSTPTKPFDVYTLPRGTAKLVRWTSSETGGLDLSDEKPAELIHWKATDGLKLAGFLFRPPARYTGKRPVIIDIHGGPEGQARPDYLDDYHEYHYLIRERGIAVIYPNVRGSVGFGKTFSKLDNGVKREDSITDIGALLDWIAQQPDLDASRVLVAGMSYGGYMTLSVATQYNNRIKASIDTVGLSNIITFLEHTAEYRRQLRRVEYGDERDPAVRAALEKIAPANLAGNLTKPMMILAGQRDPRVPYSESLQMAAAARKNNAPVWFLGMKDEGHVFQKKSNIDYGFYLKIMFVDEYLLKP